MTASNRSIGGGLRLAWVLAVVGMGLAGAVDLALGIPARTLADLGPRLRATEDERVAADLERLWPGASELLEALRSELPDGGLVVGLYPREEEAARDPDLVDRRAAAIDLVARLRILTHPTRVRPMPRRALDATELGAPGLERVRFLDLGSGDRDLLAAHLEPVRELEGGTVWRSRTTRAGE